MIMSITTRSINEFDDPKDVLLTHINNTPGIRYRELLRLTGLSNGALAYHLSGLEKSSQIRVDRQKENRTTRHYSISIPRQESDILRQLRNDVARQIIKVILEHNFISWRQTASGKPAKSVTTTIRRMAEQYRQDSVKYARYEYIYDNEDYLCGVEDDNEKEVQPAKRIEIDSVLKTVESRVFVQCIIYELQELFPNSYNRAIRKLTDCTSGKLEILPDSMKQVIRDILNSIVS